MNFFRQSMYNLYFCLDGIPSVDISITSLNNEIIQMVRNLSDDVVVKESFEQLNQHANAREYLMILVNNLSIYTLDDVKFQGSILTKLTQAGNQLTRKTLVN